MKRFSKCIFSTWYPAESIQDRKLFCQSVLDQGSSPVYTKLAKFQNRPNSETADKTSEIKIKIGHRQAGTNIRKKIRVKGKSDYRHRKRTRRVARKVKRDSRARRKYKHRLNKAKRRKNAKKHRRNRKKSKKKIQKTALKNVP